MQLPFAMPLTVPRPPRRPAGYYTHIPCPIARRWRVQGATWTPRRWLLGLPALVDERDGDAWLAWAPKGVEVAYHAGDLVNDRASDPALDLLARMLLLRSRCELPIVTPPPCGHLRGIWEGSGEVMLLQRRCGPESWLYVAKRR